MQYSLMGKMRLPFIDSDLLYRGVIEGRFDCNKILMSFIAVRDELLLQLCGGCYFGTFK